MHDDLYHKYPGTVDVKCDSARPVGSARNRAGSLEKKWSGRYLK